MEEQPGHFCLHLRICIVGETEYVKLKFLFYTFSIWEFIYKALESVEIARSFLCPIMALPSVFILCWIVELITCNKLNSYHQTLFEHLSLSVVCNIPWQTLIHDSLEAELQGTSMLYYAMNSQSQSFFSSLMLRQLRPISRRGTCWPLISILIFCIKCGWIIVVTCLLADISMPYDAQMQAGDYPIPSLHLSSVGVRTVRLCNPRGATCETQLWCHVTANQFTQMYCAAFCWGTIFSQVPKRSQLPTF